MAAISEVWIESLLEEKTRCYGCRGEGIWKEKLKVK
jgi:hypothetical protein